MRINLVDEFRFTHEPQGLPHSESRTHVVGRDREINDLTGRLLLSSGGAYLISGYRGVGKTTFVNEVVRSVNERLEDASDNTEHAQLVDVYLALARPMTPMELMHHLLRGLYQRLHELSLAERLNPSLRRELELAFMRTSFEVAYGRSEQTERSLELPLGSLPGIPITGAKLGGKHQNHRSQELKYLAYDDKAAEGDLIRLSRDLTSGYVPRRRWWSPWSSSRQVRLKVLFVLDEMDKLEGEGEPGAVDHYMVDDIIRSLKTLLTTSGISFLFVAGRELYDRWITDINRGDSVYESVFTHAMYLPAMWTHVDDLCNPMVEHSHDGTTSEHTQAFESFKGFLRYKGRGVARRVLRGFNESVYWDGTKTFLKFSESDLRRYRFYHGLEGAINAPDSILSEEMAEGNDEHVDQLRLGVYYLVDWILGRRSGRFSLEEALAASRDLNARIALSEEVAPTVVEALLESLTRHEYLERIDDVAISQVIEETEAIGRWYRVPRRRLYEMGQLSGYFERESQALTDQKAIGTVADRYHIAEEIGSGGFSTVYKALDQGTGRTVALKRFHSHLTDEPAAARIQREAEALSKLDHPGIVKLRDSGTDRDGQPFLVMDFIDGVLLSHLIVGQAPVAAEIVTAISRELLEGIGYLHRVGVLWRDAKPSNVILTGQGRVVIIDLGIAKVVDRLDVITSPGDIIGTPSHMAPETLSHERTDHRADLYAAGVIMYQLVTGQLPFQADSVYEMMQLVLTSSPEPPSAHVEVPDRLERVIMRCLEKNPDDRLQSAAEVSEALGPSPEGVDLAQVSRNAAAYDDKLQYYEELATQVGPSPISSTFDVPAASGPTLESTRWAAVPSSQAPDRGAGPELIVRRGTEEEAVHVLTGSVRLGRSVENDIVLPDSTVSRFHARIVQSPDGFVLEDFNSVYGTTVDGARIEDHMVLTDGVTFSIGAFELQFTDPDLANC